MRFGAPSYSSLELGAEGGDEVARSLLDAVGTEGPSVNRAEVDRLKAEWRAQSESAR